MIVFGDQLFKWTILFKNWSSQEHSSSEVDSSCRMRGVTCAANRAKALKRPFIQIFWKIYFWTDLKMIKKSHILKFVIFFVAAFKIWSFFPESLEKFFFCDDAVAVRVQIFEAAFDDRFFLLFRHRAFRGSFLNNFSLPKLRVAGPVMFRQRHADRASVSEKFRSEANRARMLKIASLRVKIFFTYFSKVIFPVPFSSKDLNCAS